jgi:Bifunctional DNA primase/polymerase, N-terminal
MPTNRGNGYYIVVAGDGRGRDAKGARQDAGPYRAARCEWRRRPWLESRGVLARVAQGRARLRRAWHTGLSVRGGRKRPLTADGFLEATTEEARIRRWWARWPNANVAIPTGERSGLLVLDVDAGEGTDSVSLLELSRGQSPKTARAATGGGGVHIYFRNPSGQELRAAGLYTQQVRNSQGLLGDGLDVRGEGGYVVAPPSSTLRAYRWIDRSPPARAAWLLECLRAATSGETLF